MLTGNVLRTTYAFPIDDRQSPPWRVIRPNGSLSQERQEFAAMTIDIARVHTGQTAGQTAVPALFAGLASAVLLVSALLSQYWGGLVPCEMCIWQRWPHGVSILFGLAGGMGVAAGLLPRRLARLFALIAIAALVVTGGIGIFHAGVEWKLWPGPSACTGFGYVPGRDDFGPLKVIRCDEAQFRLFGISLAGYNAIFSLGAAALALTLLRRARA